MPTWRSGQTRQTVNLLPFGFGGSNPSGGTNITVPIAQFKEALKLI